MAEDERVDVVIPVYNVPSGGMLVGEMAIPRLSFGKTNHESSRLIFGAAALGRVSQAEADRALEGLLEAGVNHIDTAAMYGDAEPRLVPWLRSHRDSFFVATKTLERTYEGAREGIRRSLERMEIEQVDLIQLHNLTDEEGFRIAHADGGAVQAAIEARDEGLVRFIGVTGHGTLAAAMHLRSLAEFPYDSVLLPYNHAMMEQAEYAEDFERLLGVCQERDVVVQTIKCVARRRWPEGTSPTHTTWYEPFEDPTDIERAVHWSLSRPGIFVNSAGDLGILRHMLRAADSFEKQPSESDMREHSRRLAVEPLFIRGYAEEVRRPARS